MPMTPDSATSALHDSPDSTKRAPLWKTNIDQQLSQAQGTSAHSLSIRLRWVISAVRLSCCHALPASLPAATANVLASQAFQARWDNLCCDDCTLEAQRKAAEDPELIVSQAVETTMLLSNT